ncbi:hypothetical protein NQD34_005658 [Periophthalmus magnuspinnatus]|nr:hypothetical protein NQD34_005658 [Periophthalmus magnuspinnatus]
MFCTSSDHAHNGRTNTEQKQNKNKQNTFLSVLSLCSFFLSVLSFSLFSLFFFSRFIHSGASVQFNFTLFKTNRNNLRSFFRPRSRSVFDLNLLPQRKHKNTAAKKTK